MIFLSGIVGSYAQEGYLLMQELLKNSGVE
jgi:hypothetical protein